MDQRPVRTKRLIIDALLDLIDELPYEAISIKEIAARAGIARTTFYMHYASKEEALGDRLRELNRRFIDRLREAIDEGRYEPSTPGVLGFSAWAGERRLFLALDKAGVAGLIQEAVRRGIDESMRLLSEKGVIERPPHEAYGLMLDYLAGAHGAMLLRWLREGCATDPERLAAFHIEMLSSIRPGAFQVFGPTKGYRFSAS